MQWRGKTHARPGASLAQAPRAGRVDAAERYSPSVPVDVTWRGCGRRPLSAGSRPNVVLMHLAMYARAVGRSQAKRVLHAEAMGAWRSHLIVLRRFSTLGARS
jgi:hypothetical protein